MNCKTETTHINQTFSLITNVLYSQSVVQQHLHVWMKSLKITI